MAEPLWKRCVRADDDGSLPSILVVWVVAVLALQFTVPVVVTEQAASASCGTCHQSRENSSNQSNRPRVAAQRTSPPIWRRGRPLFAPAQSPFHSYVDYPERPCNGRAGLAVVTISWGKRGDNTAGLHDREFRANRARTNSMRHPAERSAISASPREQQHRRLRNFAHRDSSEAPPAAHGTTLSRRRPKKNRYYAARTDRPSNRSTLSPP